MPPDNELDPFPEPGYEDGTEDVTVGYASDAKKITVTAVYRDSKDGTKIRILKYGKGDRRLLIVHGAAEYVQRYGYIINCFAENGYEVTMVELRGQGRSQGGRMVIKSHSWQEYIDDMQTAAETIDGDCTCFCHSNGGLTMAYATSTDQVPANVKKIVYSNPNIKSVAKILARLVYYLPIGFRASAGIAASTLSDSVEANSHYMNDETITKDMHSSYVTAMVKAQDVVEKFRGTKGSHLPCMFVLGTADVLANHRKAQLWAEGQKAQMDNCTITVYEGRKHEMLNGTTKDEILQDILAWLGP